MGKRAILAIGRDKTPDGELTTESKGVTEKAVELFLKGGYDYLVLCGGVGFKNPDVKLTDAELMNKIAIERGVEKGKIILEEKSRDTIGQAFFTEKIVRDMGCNRVTMVVFELQLDRAFYLFRRVYEKDIEIDAVGVDIKNPTEGKSYYKVSIKTKEKVSMEVVRWELDCVKDKEKTDPAVRFDRTCRNAFNIVNEAGDSTLNEVDMEVFKSPKVIGVKRTEWKQHGITENIISISVKRMGGYDVFVNMDHTVLLDARKRFHQKELADAQYMYAIGLVTLFSLFLQAKDPSGTISPELLLKINRELLEIVPYYAELLSVMMGKKRQ